MVEGIECVGGVNKDCCFILIRVKTYLLPSPTGPLSLQMPFSCIRAANKCMEKKLEEQVPPSRLQNQPNKEHTNSTHQKKASNAAVDGITAHIFKNCFMDCISQLKWATANGYVAIG